MPEPEPTFRAGSIPMSAIAALRALLRSARMRRYVGIGATSLGFSFCFLYLLVDILGVPVDFAPAIVAETAIVLRFLAYDRFVFGHRRPTLRRLGEYHLATATGFIVFLVVTHTLIAAGIYYLLAAVFGTSCSIGINVAANFLWIWRRPADAGSSSDAEEQA